MLSPPSARMNARQRNNKQSSYNNCSSRCACCPYGYHIDVDFVRYCEALVNAYYNTSMKNRRGKEQSSRRVDISPPGMGIDEAFHLFYESRKRNEARTKPRDYRHQGRDGSANFSDSSPVIVDYLEESSLSSGFLKDAVEKFEEALKEHELPVSSECPKYRHRDVNDSRMVMSASAAENSFSLESPPASPALSTASGCFDSSSLNKSQLAAIREQMALSLMKMRSLEEQVKNIPLLEQELASVKAEKQQLLRKSLEDTNKCDGIKFFRDEHEPKKFFFGTKDSHNNVSTSTDDMQSTSSGYSSSSSTMKSKGTLTYTIPSKSKALDPLHIEKQDFHVQVRPETCEAGTSAVVKRLVDVSVGCNMKKLCSVLGWHAHKETQTTQGVEKEMADEEVQVSQRCPHCDVKQMETVGVGDGNVFEKAMANVMEASMESAFSRVSSVQSIKLCDKCSECITSTAKEVIAKPATLPTGGSRIPRLSSKTSPTTATVPADMCQAEKKSPSKHVEEKKHNLIIEEGNDEIFVCRNPNAPIHGKHRSNFPNMMQHQLDNLSLFEEFCKISDSDGDPDDDSSSSSSSDEEQSYELKKAPRIKAEPSIEMTAALKVFTDSLLSGTKRQATIKSRQIIEKEWFRVSAQKDSKAVIVEDYVDCFEKYSKHLLNQIVNLADGSGNTAMHYAISHSNFDIVSVLLDSKVCDVNTQNKAGYTCTMLVSLAKIHSDTQREVIRRLFSLGDVNVRAKQNGQTALMLASSHGQFITCKLLIEAGAALNVRDNDGSTSLMCAAEHGHKEVVRLLLSHPDCDPNISDNDGATALSIAMEASHKDIGLMLYANTNLNISRGSSPYASLRRSQASSMASNLRRTGSFTYAEGGRRLQLPSPPRSRRSSTGPSLVPRSRNSSISKQK